MNQLNQRFRQKRINTIATGTNLSEIIYLHLHHLTKSTLLFIIYKSTLLFIAFLLTSYASSAQYLYPEKFKGCILGFGLDLGTPKAKAPDDFADKIIENLDPATLTKIEGSIEVQILIDTLGQPCLLSANNKTNVTCKALGLQTAINSSSKWEPAIYYGIKTDVCVMLLLQFKKDILSVARIKFDPANIRNK